MVYSVSRHGNAVILSKEDYDAITETACLLRNSANTERLLASIERVGGQRPLADPGPQDSEAHQPADH